MSRGVGYPNTPPLDSSVRGVYRNARMQIIENSEGVAEACATLAKGSYVTLDTEFERTSTYWPKLCLIQIAGHEDNEVFIIDPLAKGIDLSAFYGLMADESVLKVLHAARQDLEIFLHESGALPHPIFDSQVAAMVCGFGDSVGYDTLARKLADAHIDKSSRFADWARRPLTKKQLNYAAGDVTHLRDIYKKLAEALHENERESWLNEEMTVLTEPTTYIVEPLNMWHRLKTRSNNRRFLAYVQQLAAWRELTARERDVPRNRVLRDDILLELAAHPPKDADELSRIRKLPGNLSGADKAGIAAAIAAGRDLPDDELPKSVKSGGPPKGAGPIMDLLKVLLKAKAEHHGVAQRLVANVAELERIAADDEADVPAMHGWRFELFGKDALEMKHGRLGLSVQDGEVTVLPTGSGVSGAS